MKETMNESQFIDRFRAIRPENFSIPALRALFEWVEDVERDTGEEWEFDPIALCVDFAEYTEAELRQEWPELLEDCEDMEDIVDIMEQETTVLRAESAPHIGKEEETLVLGPV